MGEGDCLGVRPGGGGNECDPESKLLKGLRETGQSEETISHERGGHFPNQK